MKFDIHALFSAQYAKWIIISLISLFSLLIVLAFVSFLGPLIKPSAFPEAKQVKISAIKQSPSDYILHSSLFGVYVSNDLNGDNVKKSMLDVSLVGILLGDNTTESQVIIRSASGDESSYIIDDKIPGGAVIKRIMEGGILVERAGVIESLSLPKNELTFEPVAKPLIEE